MFPANNLEKYFTELAEQSWTLIPIDKTIASALQISAESKFNTNQFKAARISREELPTSEIRSDSIFWLDAKNNNLSAFENQALSELESLMILLKDYFRISLTEFECHYARYQPGHFYGKHQDTTPLNNKRIFSFVVYLNANWKNEDGGELVGYENENPIFKIAPAIGTMILFKSDLMHEVLKTASPRYSLTGWMRR